MGVPITLDMGTLNRLQFRDPKTDRVIATYTTKHQTRLAKEFGKRSANILHPRRKSK